ncbi:MAG: hypothetical protein COZ07_01910 [Candidatus Infernicultor aquiphilus]|jgi:HEPN domain-containing protein|uniref:HEPN domain-containing protein n=1 Tax=Candidatus Infernicultor aquiphilus TaxID=1805029 RepID=A0A2M7PT58_9BACT|nr:hypothetical protein [bacterium]PIU24931.1 MAG: hypothetical protein COT11_05235 [Candidatus Atribacteria bacterium CG08_land_8_20_14_0_20_33_29]PIW11774.1 MAG: hypothetical protein COW35_05155 [Candidatus Atribacteria bacterium CG17_big_fil_post_rev_8_21_14_2_50_34_11]PIX33880.1 MAG: hypothetical protein COZ58_05985 [Candidatus Atribacteria bacterium CG_4_8_14_3_um_filter_34_18]PIY33522.1 MAG: hypothetical protein COZ07_01910 [Candidatus Atribacteria bacterium CG_4_10_14_3_um_filter_34_13]
MRKDTNNFIKSAEYDLNTAEFMLKLGNIQLPLELFNFMAKINNASIVTRYPEDFLKILEAYPKSVAEEYLSNTKEIHECLKKHKTLKK